MTTLRKRTPEGRMAYYEGRMGELIGRIVAAEVRVKHNRQRLRVMKAMWKMARRDWLAERRAARASPVPENGGK